MKLREFQQQHADLLLESFAGPEKGRFKKIRIQEILVESACAKAESGQVTESLDRDFVRDFKSEQKIIGDSVRQKIQVAAVGKFVIGGIDANGLEHFGVFRQAKLLESRFGKLASPDVAIMFVELSLPTRIFPRGSADENALFCQRFGGCFHTGAIKWHGHYCGKPD